MGRRGCAAGVTVQEPVLGKDLVTWAVIDLLGLGGRNCPSGQKPPFSTSDWQELTQDSEKCPTLPSMAVSTRKTRLTSQVSALVFSYFPVWTKLYIWAFVIFPSSGIFLLSVTA